MILQKLGFGTGYTDVPTTTRLCLDALDIGYHHIDTAQGYKNEEGVGIALKETSVSRSDIFITTKIWVDNYSYTGVIDSFHDSLNKLQTEYVDQLMIHWPRDIKTHHEMFDAMMKLKRDDKIKHISVSNFPISELEDAISYTGGNILANQIENHVYLEQEKLKKFCIQNDIEVVAYAPLCRGDVFKDQILQKIADKHSTGIAQIALAWLIQQQGVVTLTGGLERIYLEQNIQALGLVLDADDIALIYSLPKNKRYYGDGTENSPAWDD